MYMVKMATVLVQVGTNMWVNPQQVASVWVENNTEKTVRICGVGQEYCSSTDWPIEKVLKALNETKKQ